MFPLDPSSFLLDQENGLLGMGVDLNIHKMSGIERLQTDMNK